MPERRLNPPVQVRVAIQATFELLSAPIQGRAWPETLSFLSTMSIYAFTELRESDSAVDRAARHLRVWLAATGASYDPTARDLFVRAHPVLFGRDSELTLRGYDRWRWRRRLHDTAATFARYMAPRHQRWITVQGDATTMAPCLIGTGNVLPCWAYSACESSRVQGELRSAA
jgi:hypothetical protein